MKRALIIILTVSLIITLFFFVFFFKNFDKRQSGIGYEYFNELDVDYLELPYCGGSSSAEFPSNATFGISQMSNNSILFGDFMIFAPVEYWKFFDDSSVANTPISYYVETYVYISHISDKNIFEGSETVRHWSSPFIKLKAYGYITAHSSNNYDWSFQINRLEAVANSELFLNTISNNLTIFQKSLIDFEDVNNAFDLVEYLGTLLKELFILISNVFKDIARFLT